MEAERPVNNRVQHLEVGPFIGSDSMIDFQFRWIETLRFCVAVN
jgi:hypothetical protein